LAVDILRSEPSETTEIGLKRVDEDRRVEEVERRIRSCSGGLLEVAKGRVQFVHQTVKSFIADPQNSGSLNGRSMQDIALAGMQQMMRLATLLTAHMEFT
jgi:hypothetical protein